MDTQGWVEREGTKLTSVSIPVLDIDGESRSSLHE